MLNEETKRKINNARDVLVGKVPDPKAQVEQITLALLYKFMDDMDKNSIALGGKAGFFVGDYQKYAWSRMMDPKISGHERLHLYGEGLVKMAENRNLPDLFREIFKDAYLPYRSPDTLHLFLKEINGFKYEHSEDLGDAYEYLLSVLGSQGDAGQFRTPRHIIDFIVAAVNPQPREKICDPACGTAGFLISAYKHILAQNPDLTPDEREKLAGDIAGYDISPDMVRLSKANLYLHGFAAPRISEYDTLTSEERWEERFDVMLANPPFMTPKGGIRPHKRFAVQANRSEVLFVDYILEHLKPEGRAGIIVPEGIIFQAANAYKQLRKLLLEDGLLAVISLPAGVFNPYSGVKTSILLFDNRLAGRTDKLLFVKINRDGYDLGAQRREKPGENDLPPALSIIKKYRQNLENGEEPVLSEEEGKIAHLTPKEKIAENGDYNLSGDRYRITETITHQKWPLVELGEVSEIEKGTSITKAQITEGAIPVIAGGQQPAYYHNISNREGKTITVSASGAYAGFLNYFDHPIFASDCTTIKTKDENKLRTDFLFYLLKLNQENIYKLRQGAGQPHLYGKDLAKIKIPLPSLEVQREIVEQIEVKQKAIQASKETIAALERETQYFGRVLRKLDCELIKLGDCVNFISGLTLSIPDSVSENGTPIISINNITEDGRITLEGIRTIRLPNNKTTNYLKKGDLLFNWRNGSKHLVGKTGYFDLEGKYVFASFLLGIRTRENKLLPKFLWHLLNSYRADGRYMQFMRQNVNGLFNREELKILEIPLPAIDIQEKLVNELEQEQEIIEANRRLIALMEEKIQTVLADL